MIYARERMAELEPLRRASESYGTIFIGISPKSFTETRDSGAGCLSSGWMSCSETVNGCIAAGCKLHRNLFAIFFADLLAPVVYWREETLAMATFYES